LTAQIVVQSHTQQNADRAQVNLYKAGAMKQDSIQNKQASDRTANYLAWQGLPTIKIQPRRFSSFPDKLYLKPANDHTMEKT
jgi:hypothetical protein